MKIELGDKEGEILMQELHVKNVSGLRKIISLKLGNSAQFFKVDAVPHEDNALVLDINEAYIVNAADGFLPLVLSLLSRKRNVFEWAKLAKGIKPQINNMYSKVINLSKSDITEKKNDFDLYEDDEDDNEENLFTRKK